MASLLRTIVVLGVLVFPTAAWAVDPAEPLSQELRDLGVTKVYYRPSGTPRHLIGKIGRVRPESAEGDIQGLLLQLAEVLKITGNEGFWMYGQREGGIGRVYELRQTLYGHPVRGGRIRFVCDPRTGDVKEIIAHYIPADTVPKEPRLTAREAFRNVPAYLQNWLEPTDGLPLAERTIEEVQAPETQYTFFPSGRGRLVWRFVVNVTSRETPPELIPLQLWEVKVDALDGSEAGLGSMIRDLPGRDRRE